MKCNTNGIEIKSFSHFQLIVMPRYQRNAKTEESPILATVPNVTVPPVMEAICVIKE